MVNVVIICRIRDRQANTITSKRLRVQVSCTQCLVRVSTCPKFAILTACIFVCLCVCVEYNSRHRKHSRWRSAHLRVRLQLTAISSHSHSHSQSAIATATATATATVTATAVAAAIILVAGRCKCNHAPVIYCRALVKRYAGLRQSAATM